MMFFIITENSVQLDSYPSIVVNCTLVPSLQGNKSHSLPEDEISSSEQKIKIEKIIKCQMRACFKVSEN